MWFGAIAELTCWVSSSLSRAQAGRTVEVGRAQLAQVGLESVHHPRHHGLDLLHEGLIRNLEDHLHLQILATVGARDWRD